MKGIGIISILVIVGVMAYLLTQGSAFQTGTSAEDPGGLSPIDAAKEAAESMEKGFGSGQ